MLTCTHTPSQVLLKPEMAAVLSSVTARGGADLRLLDPAPALRAAAAATAASTTSPRPNDAANLRVEDLDAYAAGLSRTAGRQHIVLGVLRAGAGRGGHEQGEMLMNPPRGMRLGLRPGDSIVVLRGRRSTDAPDAAMEAAVAAEP